MLGLFLAQKLSKNSLARDRDALGAAVGVRTLQAPHAALNGAPEALPIVHCLIARRQEVIEGHYRVLLRSYDSFVCGCTPIKGCPRPRRITLCMEGKGRLCYVCVNSSGGLCSHVCVNSSPNGHSSTLNPFPILASHTNWYVRFGACY